MIRPEYIKLHQSYVGISILAFLCFFRNIEDLTRDINEIHLEMNDINLENEEMRDRLGIVSRDELDVDNIRKKKAVKEEQAAALNRVLQKEVVMRLQY